MLYVLDKRQNQYINHYTDLGGGGGRGGGRESQTPFLQKIRPGGPTSLKFLGHFHSGPTPFCFTPDPYLIG